MTRFNGHFFATIVAGGIVDDTPNSPGRPGQAPRPWALQCSECGLVWWFTSYNDKRDYIPHVMMPSKIRLSSGPINVTRTMPTCQEEKMRLAIG